MNRTQGHREICDVVAERDPWKEVVEVAEGDDGKERDIDGVVEHQGGAGHEPREIAQPSQCEVLAASGEGIGGSQFRVAQADQGENDAGRQEGERRQAKRGQRDDSQRGIDVGADRGIAPHVGAPDRNVAPELAPGNPLDRVVPLWWWRHRRSC